MKSFACRSKRINCLVKSVKVASFFMNDVCIVDKPSAESHVSHVDHLQFFMAAVMNCCMHAAHGGSHCGSVHLQAVAVPKGEHIVFHQSFDAVDDKFSWKVGRKLIRMEVKPFAEDFTCMAIGMLVCIAAASATMRLQSCRSRRPLMSLRKCHKSFIRRTEVHCSQ